VVVAKGFGTIYPFTCTANIVYGVGKVELVVVHVIGESVWG
jgi:hypothetical protein